ncbi:hypothetical protein [Mumia sp.]|uniref:hypothetical protein n=1 Tax=Mumia sp. TaxID=1965300 RepID=UPI00260FD564|nr:hypothetical protein [Mumia sp.]MDD9350266.1 hypothetical protein [Mumia sp.]
MHRVVLSLATTVVALTACSSAADRVDDVSSNPTPAPASLAPPALATLPGGWFAEPLPGRTRPASVEAAGDRLVVGGSVGSGDGARPRLLAHEGSVWADVPLEPATGYGRIASLVHLAVAPDGGVVALGNATGGAHLMPRWTAWSGTLDGVAEVPQVFETFGGPSAGGLTGLTAAPVDAVVGSWATSPSRLSPAVWREDGGRWVRRTDIGPFSSAGDVQALPTAVGATGSAVVVVGTETVTADAGTRQTAAAWTTPDLRTWRRLALGPSDGPSSGAVDVACAGDACLVAGWVGDRLAGWRIGAEDVRRIRLPAVRVEPYVAQPRAAYDGSCAAIAVGAESRTALVSADTARWAATDLPQPHVSHLAMTRGRLFVLTPDGATALVSHAEACDLR